MVLVHKIKESEKVDMNQFLDGEDAEGENESPPASGPEDAALSNEQATQDPPSSSSKKRASSPPRRPITRSQTHPGVSRPSYRKVVAAESEPDVGSSSKAKTRPKTKVTPLRSQKAPPPAPSTRKRPIAEVESEDEGENNTANKRRDTSETSIPFELSLSRAQSKTPPLQAAQADQLPLVAPAPEDLGLDPHRRGARIRAALPVPVPNLTKKSRGRRVPTKAGASVEKEKEVAQQKDTRIYVCKVEGCGKCFHRGEHLKRHIRSIHTHEKPFKCSHPACDKFFNRHDNLLQHLKVHKDLPPSAALAERANGSASRHPKARNASPQQSPEASQSASQMQLQQPHPATAPSGTYIQPMLNPFANIDANTFTTNLAIALLSSLRDNVQFSQLRAELEQMPSAPRMGMAVSDLRTEMSTSSQQPSFPQQPQAVPQSAPPSVIAQSGPPPAGMQIDAMQVEVARQMAASQSQHASSSSMAVSMDSNIDPSLNNPGSQNVSVLQNNHMQMDGSAQLDHSSVGNVNNNASVYHNTVPMNNSNALNNGSPVMMLPTAAAAQQYIQDLVRE